MRQTTRPCALGFSDGAHAAQSNTTAADPAPSPACPAAAETTAWGTELGLPTGFDARFEMGVLLGVGSFGTVHLAVDRTSGREVAVKKLRKDLPRGLQVSRRGTGRISRQKLLKRLRREIDTLRSLDGCPSAIAFEGAFEDPGHVYLVMEYCRGGDLDTLLKACGALGERYAAMVVYEVLRLVRCCHDARILHGDIKPSNFLLSPGNPVCPAPLPAAASGASAHRAMHRDIEAQQRRAAEGTTLSEEQAAQPRFCPLPAADSTGSDLCVPYAGGWLKGVDFGCSHEAPAGASLTKMTGTPAFMAPEVFARRFSIEADMWSLGMLAYQAISNRLPFWQDEDDMRETSMTEVRSAVVDDPIPLDFGPWLDASPACHDFVTRLLQHDPKTRLTAAEAQAHPWFSEQGISAEPACNPAADRAAASSILPLEGQHSAEGLAAASMLRQSPSTDNFAAV